MPVVFAAYETDVISHSWSGEENDERRRENLTLFRSPPPLFNPTTQSKTLVLHIHRQQSAHNAVHYGPPDMWKRGKQRWRAWWRSVQSCGWWRCCKARSRTWEGRAMEEEAGRKRGRMAERGGNRRREDIAELICHIHIKCIEHYVNIEFFYSIIKLIFVYTQRFLCLYEREKTHWNRQTHTHTHTHTHTRERWGFIS